MIILSPDINSSKQQITASFSEILKLDGYAHGANNTTVGMLASDPAWLPAVRDQIGMLSVAGGKWILARPGIWASVLLQFPDYITLFNSIAEAQQAGRLTSSELWIDLLQQTLIPQLDKAVMATDQADLDFQSQYANFSAVLPLLTESIDAGWSALSDEEQQMTEIANELGKLQAEVASLQDDITSEAISSGKSTISSAVSITYNLLSAATVSVPFLSAASMAFTVGKMFYDVIHDTEEINKLLEHIGELQLKASLEAQAAAGTKMVLRLLYDMEISFKEIQDSIPELSRMWKTERDKVSEAIDALIAGADPAALLALTQIPVAKVNWAQIGGFVTNVQQCHQAAGKPVILEPVPDSTVTNLR